MAQKLGMLFSVAAFLVAWLSGLAAGVPPDVILKRSLIGAGGFYLLALALCHISGALLGFPGKGPEPDASERAKSYQTGNPRIESKE